MDIPLVTGTPPVSNKKLTEKDTYDMNFPSTIMSGLKMSSNATYAQSRNDLDMKSKLKRNSVLEEHITVNEERI